MVRQETLAVATHGPGLYEITGQVSRLVARAAIDVGLVTVFCQHTSASLVLMENADPSAQRDLLAWFERAVPADDPNYTHVAEGADDMPGHIKMALTRTSETIPVAGGRLRLGTWQGLFLWEHRRAPHQRAVVVTVLGEAGR